MKTAEQIVFELLDIYPRLVEAKGFIFFGTLAEKPPYEMASYHSYRITFEESSEYKKARKAIGFFLDSLLADTRISSLPPHGYIKIQNSVIDFQWTTKDIVDTMLDNIDKLSNLKGYYDLID